LEVPKENNRTQGGSLAGGWADTGLMVLMIALVLWILRRQTVITDDIGTKLDRFSAKITKVDGDIAAYKDSWDARKEGLLDIVSRLCHERQDACGKYMQTPIEGVQKQNEQACKKIEGIRHSREKKWDDQEKLNRELLKNNRKGNNDR
jgi:hypothetical protein